MRVLLFFFGRVLEEACKNDDEMRAVLGDSIGNPELMRKRVDPGFSLCSVYTRRLCCSDFLNVSCI